MIEKTGIARKALLCLLAVGYFIIGFNYLFDAFPLENEEVEIELEENDRPTIINIVQFRKRNEEEEGKHDA